MSFPIGTKERRQALLKIKIESNFNLYLNGIIRPKKQLSQEKDTSYYPCVYCKVIYTKNFLHRHAKNCFAKQKLIGLNSNAKVNYVSKSQTAVACASDPTETISKLNIKEQVIYLISII